MVSVLAFWCGGTQERGYICQITDTVISSASCHWKFFFPLGSLLRLQWNCNSGTWNGQEERWLCPILRSGIRTLSILQYKTWTNRFMSGNHGNLPSSVLQRGWEAGNWSCDLPGDRERDIVMVTDHVIFLETEKELSSCHKKEDLETD